MQNTEFNFNMVKVRAYDAIVDALRKEAEEMASNYVTDNFSSDYYLTHHDRCDAEAYLTAAEALFNQFNEITSDTAALDAFNKMLEDATGYKA